MKSGGVRKVYCLCEMKGWKYFVVYEDVLECLYEYFYFFNEKFYEMVGWNFYWFWREDLIEL